MNVFFSMFQAISSVLRGGMREGDDPIDSQMEHTKLINFKYLMLFSSKT